MEEYNVEKYVNPLQTYRTLHDKFKIGHLIFDFGKKRIALVDITILSKIFDKERGGEEGSENAYGPLSLSDEWLEKVFEFEAKFSNTTGMTVFTSRRHGLKIHKQRGNYYLGYIFREKMNIGGWKGSSSSKPEILFVNELMDYCYLLRRDSFQFNEGDLKRINDLITVKG